MKCVTITFLLAVCYYVSAEHYIVGNPAMGQFANSEKVQYNAIPFIKRVKYYFYTQQDNRKIVAIQALDNLHSKSSINITAGGVGYSYTNLRLKSERGVGLDYDVGIYVEPSKY